jgi:hypothetical protein
VLRLKSTEVSKMHLFEVTLRTNYESLYFVNQVQGFIRNSIDMDQSKSKLNKSGYKDITLRGKTLPHCSVFDHS